MATTYCSVGDVSDFLRVPITSTSTPNKKQIQKIINRKEDEIDRRIGHAWRSKKVTRRWLGPPKRLSNLLGEHIIYKCIQYMETSI